MNILNKKSKNLLFRRKRYNSKVASKFAFFIESDIPLNTLELRKRKQFHRNIYLSKL